MTPRSAHQHGHAVVLGASMAGLATAAALSRHFHDVTIVERDALVDHPALRPGVPQAEHLHVLLSGGEAALERLLPGYSDGLVAAGAVAVGMPTDMLWLNRRGWVQRFAPRRRLLSASRGLIEWHTRRMVDELANVTVLDRHNVLDLQLSNDRRRVVGVAVAPTDTTTPEGITSLDAGLVVDATGRRSRLPDWLERLGFERPTETRIDAHLKYATRIFRRPAGSRDWSALFIQAAPPAFTRMGLLFPIEGDRWMVTLQGVGSDQPPTSAAGFVEFASSLRSPAIGDAITAAEPLTDAVGWANTANLRHHYDRLATLPDRLLVVGDGACCFNPVYGQGMSVAAKTAVALDDELASRPRRAGLDGFAHRMQRIVAKTGDGAWMMATADDLRCPTTTGASATRVMRAQHRYLDRALAAATVDEKVLQTLSDVFLLVAPPPAIFRPSVIARVVRHGGSPNTSPPDGRLRLGERRPTTTSGRPASRNPGTNSPRWPVGTGVAQTSGSESPVERVSG